jgi:dihydroorotate dehydrogenase (NAD+) catalytic subunit
LPELSVQLAPKNKKGLLLSNPVMNASGTFGYGIEYAGLFDIQRLGAIVCKATTLEPREGNPQPRLVETPCGVINSIGLQNIGVKAVIKEKAPIWAGWRVPVIVNIAGDTAAEYGKLAGALDGVAGVSGIEVNVSCPNVRTGGAAFGAIPEAAAEAIAAARAATSLPLIVKLTPNTGDIRAVARAVAGAGADAVSLINSPRGMVIDIESRRPLMANKTGGGGGYPGYWVRGHCHHPGRAGVHHGGGDGRPDRLSHFQQSPGNPRRAGRHRGFHGKRGYKEA